jgi:hypothetical protein
MKALKWFNKEERRTTGGARLCLMILCDMANTENICWPGHELLRDRCNVGTERTVANYLETLISLDLVEQLTTRQEGYRGYFLPQVPLELSEPDDSLTGNPFPVTDAADQKDDVVQPENPRTLTGKSTYPPL